MDVVDVHVHEVEEEHVQEGGECCECGEAPAGGCGAPFARFGDRGPAQGGQLFYYGGGRGRECP